MEGLTKRKVDMTVYVHPSKSNNVQQAVFRQLSTLLFKYDEVFEGVILAYEANIQGKSGRILPGLIPHFGVKVEANLLLFSPRPSMSLEAKVVKLGKESIHAIVLGFSSAVIMAEDIREEFKYKIKDNAGVFASIHHKRHMVKVGSMIRFNVKRFDEEALHFSGSLIEQNTGCVRWLSKHDIKDELQTPLPDRNLKRHRERAIKNDTPAQDHRLYIEDDLSVNPSRPHKSRKRTRE